MAYGIFVKVFSTKRNSLIKKKLDVTGKLKKLYTTIKTAILLNPVTFFFMDEKSYEGEYISWVMGVSDVFFRNFTNCKRVWLTTFQSNTIDRQ